MAHMTERKCKCCGVAFQARTADVKRGWARFCSKSCKATHQDRRGGVSAATVRHYAETYGGTPEFDRHGTYVGFRDVGFDNTEHQDK